jgi:O-antigen ligase
MIGVLVAALVVGLIFASVQIERGALKFITEAGSRKGAGLPLRMTTWKDALRMAREDGGVFGVGIGNYQAYSEAKVTFSNLRHIRLASAHSMFLQILAEQGLPGVIAWMAFFVVLIRYFLRNLKRSEAGDNIRRAINLWLLAATAMVAVDGFMYMDFLPPAYAHGSLTAGYYVWIAMGLAVAYNRLDTNPPGESLWR